MRHHFCYAGELKGHLNVSLTPRTAGSNATSLESRMKRYTSCIMRQGLHCFFKLNLSHVWSADSSLSTSPHYPQYMFYQLHFFSVNITFTISLTAWHFITAYRIVKHCIKNDIKINSPLKLTTGVRMLPTHGDTQLFHKAVERDNVTEWWDHKRPEGAV